MYAKVQSMSTGTTHRVSTVNHNKYPARNETKEHTNSFRSFGWNLVAFSPMTDPDTGEINGTKFVWEKRPKQ